jgi:hypothetical protein
MKRASKGLIYTILADGKPIVALEASVREAASVAKEEWFRAEVSALNSNGEPICGTESKLQARPAIEEEIASYRQGSKEAEDSNDLLFVYLVDLRRCVKPPTCALIAQRKSNVQWTEKYSTAKDSTSLTSGQTKFTTCPAGSCTTSEVKRFTSQRVN